MIWTVWHSIIIVLIVAIIFAPFYIVYRIGKRRGEKKASMKNLQARNGD